MLEFENDLDFKDFNPETLTPSQKLALSYLISGDNVFLTGQAGVGKTFLLNYFKYLMELQKKKIAVCAPTGVAALHAGGVTIHRAFGLPVGGVLDFRHPEKIRAYVSDVVKEANIIIIDEVSMCRADLFDTVVYLLNKVDSGHKKQIVLCGDFFQLPPIIHREDIEPLKHAYPKVRDGYAYEGELWSSLNLKFCSLNEIVRQNDTEFIEALNKLRMGDVSCIKYFEQLTWKPEDRVARTLLAPRNDSVDRVNRRQLEKVPSKKVRTYDMYTEGEVRVSNLIEESRLSLKVGAQIMALKNEPDRYYNGKLGRIRQMKRDSVVVEWDDGESDEIKREERDIAESYVYNGQIRRRVVGSYSQIPVKLAYALTIHKSQGMTLDRAFVVPNAFAAGQLYVALSRCKSPEGLRLLGGIQEWNIIASESVKEFYEKFKTVYDLDAEERIREVVKRVREIVKKGRKKRFGGVDLW